MILLAVRLFLAAVLAVAAVAKLMDRRGAERAVTDLGLPPATAPLLAWIVPVIELTIAALLLPAATAWWAGVAALVLLAAFTATMAINLWRGRTPDCHCFGQLTAGPIGRGTLLRNLLLVALAALLALSPHSTVSLSAIAWLAELTTGERALVGIGVVAVVLLAVAVALLVRLLHQNERLFAALAEAQIPFEDEPVVRQDVALPSGGLPIGAPAPPFQLSDLDGQMVTLADLLRPNLPLALFFVSPTCGPCAAMLPDIARWRQQYGELMTFAFISSGSREENQQKFADAGTVLLQSGSEVSTAYEARWTPAVLIVKADGSIASRLASGSEAIRRLIIQAVTTAGSNLAALRVEMNGNGQPSESAMQIGQPAPPLALPDLNGTLVKLDDFKGERTLVVFWSPDCTFCEKMVGELKRIEASPPPHAPRLLVVSKGSIEANRAAGLQSSVVLDSEFAVGQRFGASGTPSAVLVDERGLIASEVVSGESGVLALAGLRKAVH
ncbi:MAG: TlpA family protein disulfide reductase [Blastocatellia bacterium]